MTAFALGVYAYELTHSATAGAVIALLSFLPMILLSVIGGVLADRIDRRLLMICGDFFSAFGLLYILLCIRNGHIAMWQIYIGVIISSVFASLIEPAYKATVTDLLTEEEFAKASGLVQIASAAKYLISPFIAGIILNISDISSILIIDIATFAVTVGTLTLVRRDLKVHTVIKEHSTLLKELKEGLQAITERKGVFTLVLLMTVVCFYMGVVQILMTPMVLAFSNAKVLGYMESISAIGMLIGSLCIGIFNIKGNYLKLLQRGLIAAGIFIAVMGTNTNLWAIGAAAMLFFTTLPIINTCADVMIRRSIPNELQGRVWGMIGLISQLGYVAAYMGAGILADYVFNPLLVENGLLADSVGRIIGIGNGRGIGLMLILAGILMSAVAVRMRSIRALGEI